MIDNHSMDRLVKDVLMMELVMHTEKNDIVFHTEKTGMLMLVVKIDVGGMAVDVVNKLTCLSDDVQPRQVDLRRESVQELRVDLKLFQLHIVPTSSISNDAQIGPFQATNGKRAKVKVKACLNFQGIVYVDSEQLIKEEELKVPVTKEPKKEATKMDSDDASA
nr:heat shock 70 kDa protein 15-like [Tanacetum cinerariifolium]